MDDAARACPCGRPLPVRSGRRGRPAVYCSRACQARAYRARRAARPAPAPGPADTLPHHLEVLAAAAGGRGDPDAVYAAAAAATSLLADLITQAGLGLEPDHPPTGDEPMPTRTVLLPDLDDEITRTLEALEEVLLAAGDDPRSFSAPAALESVRRLYAAVAPTQGEHATRYPGRLLAPDGRYEHLPLRPIQLGEHDIGALAELAAALGDPHGDDWLRELVDDLATTYDRGTGGRTDKGRRLIMRAAGLAGLLTLEDTPDTDQLHTALAGAGPAGDLVLTPETEAAYQRLANRINQMWAGDQLDRWKY